MKISEVDGKFAVLIPPSFYSCLIYLGARYLNFGTIFFVATVLVILAIFGYYIFENLSARASNAQPRLNRLLSGFTHIEKFVIDKSGKKGGIDDFLTHLENIRVEHLEIRDDKCNKDKQ